MTVFQMALAGAVLPCLAWLAFFYTRDTNPEPKPLIARLFLIGAIPVVLVAGTLNSVILLALTGGDLSGTSGAVAFTLLAVVVAPVTEETLKYLGASRGARRHRAFDEPVDGMIYGTTVGLGFAAVETIDYLVNAYEGFGPLGTPVDFCTPGAECFLFTVFARGLGSALLHATASGIAGYGLSRRVLDGAPRRTAVGWVLVAMLVHAMWNGLSFVTLVVPIAIYAVLMRRSLRRSPVVGHAIAPGHPQWYRPPGSR